MILRHVVYLLLFSCVLISYGARAGVPGDFNGFESEHDAVITLSTAEFSIPLVGKAEFQLTTPDVAIDELDLSKFQPLTEADVNQGITNQAAWVRIRVHNSTPQTVRWVVYNETSYLDDMTIYAKSPDRELRVRELSDHLPFSTRNIDYQRLAMAYGTTSQSYTDLYIRLGHRQAESLNLTLNLADLVSFNGQAQDESLAYGIYYGIMLLLFLTAVLLGTMLKQATYWAYAGFILFTGLMWAMINGVAFQYLWPESPYWHNIGYNVFYLLAAVFALQFSKHFLDTATRLPRLHALMTALQAVYLVGVLLRFCGVYVPVLYLSYFALAALPLLGFVGYLAYRDGIRYARWYAMAWIIYGFGLWLSVLSAGTSWFNWGLEPLLWAQIGSALESIFLLIALCERFVVWEEERQQALVLAHQDDLTGLGNRRRLRTALAEFRRRAKQNDQPVFLLLVRFANLHEVMQQQGHDAADMVLCDMGQTLLSLVRAGDVCIRYNGEEFIVLLQAENRRGAQQIAYQIQDEAAASPSQIRGTFIRHRLEIGMTSVPLDDDSFTEQHLINNAEQALELAQQDNERPFSYRDAQRT